MSIKIPPELDTIYLQPFSKLQAESVRNYMIQQPKQVGLITRIAVTPAHPHAFVSAWGISKYPYSNSEMEKIISKSFEFNKLNQSVLRCLLRWIIYIPKKNLNNFTKHINFFIELAMHPKTNDIAVVCNSLHILLRFSYIYPELLSDLTYLCEYLNEQPVPAIQSVCRKIKKRLGNRNK